MVRRSRPAPERELGAERDEGGRHVADRRAVGDIAADRAGVADLDAADPADQLAEIRMQPGQRLAGVGIADGRAERERVRALLDLPQIGDVADEDGRAEVAMLLGDPQADIGGPGDDAGLGMREEEVGQLVGGGRMAVSGPQRAQRRDDGLVIFGRHRHGLARREDRAVAGAAAQIAGDDVAHRHALGARRADAAAVERHHEAGRAEAALRAVALDQLALDRVRAAQAFDGPQRLAVEHRQEEDAGIDRAPLDRVAVQLAEQHGAGAAIALGAAFLGAGAAERVAQIVEDGGGGIGVFDLDHLAVEEEADHLGLPAAIQAPSLCRSAGVMRGGIAQRHHLRYRPPPP